MRTLTEAESDKFLNIHKHLILFTNQKHHIYGRFKTIDDLCRLSDQDKMEGIKPIREKMYELDSAVFSKWNKFDQNMPLFEL